MESIDSIICRLKELPASRSLEFQFYLCNGNSINLPFLVVVTVFVDCFSITLSTLLVDGGEIILGFIISGNGITYLGLWDWGWRI